MQGRLGRGPFLYLFLGNDRAILLDTGDTADRDRCDVAGTVGTLLTDWLGRRPRPEDMPAFVDSLERLVELTTGRRVTAVMGCHLEMSRTAGRDFPFGARYQPDEAPLSMTVEQLVRIRDRAREVADRPGEHRFDDVVIYNGRCTVPMLRLIARGGLATARRRWSSIRLRRT